MQGTIFPTSSVVLPLSTKGDVLTYGTALTGLAVGTSGTVLTADPSQPAGIGYSVPIDPLVVQIFS